MKSVKDWYGIQWNTMSNEIRSYHYTIGFVEGKVKPEGSVARLVKPEVDLR